MIAIRVHWSSDIAHAHVKRWSSARSVYLSQVTTPTLLLGPIGLGICKLPVHFVTSRTGNCRGRIVFDDIGNQFAKETKSKVLLSKWYMSALEETGRYSIVPVYIYGKAIHI